MNVSRPSIEEIDKINNSGTLRGITFFCDKEKTTKKEEIKEENEEIKEIEEIDDVDSFEFDEEISVSNDDNIDDDMMIFNISIFENFEKYVSKCSKIFPN